MRVEKIQLEKILAELGAFGNMALLSKTVDGRHVISTTCYHCEDKVCERQSTCCEERIWDMQCTGEIYIGKRDRVFETLKDAAKAWLPIRLHFASLGIIRFTIKEMRRIE